MKKNLQHLFILMAALFMLASKESRSQTVVIQFADDSMATTYCGYPFTVQYMVYGNTTGFTSSDSVSIYTNWGDLTSTTVYYHLTGSPSFFYGGYNHTYQLPGTYSTYTIVTGPGGIADTVINVNDIIDSAQCGNIDGRLYDDANSNCIYDNGETLIAYAPVRLMIGSVPVDSTYSTANGYYYFTAPIGSYSVEVASQISNFGYSVSCPLSNLINIPSVPSYNNNFGLTCTPAFDLVANLWSQRFRPGFNSSIYPHVMNTNCQAVSGQAKLIIDNPLLTYVSSTTPPTSISGDTLIWNFTSTSNNGYFSPGPVYVYTSTSAPLGDSICLTLLVEPTVGDVVPSNNNVSICRLISNSFDPNDKDVSPHGAIASGSWLSYTIQFQNTGNDTAYQVNILDTVDSNLDMLSLQVVGSSHSNDTYVINGNVVKFDFPNIMLPDSNVDEPNSHGWISYRVKSRNGLPDGSYINNTAHIYFDFNTAIVTNTTVNVIDNSVSVPERNNEVATMILAPNPASSQFTIYDLRFTIESIELFDVIGNKIFTSHLNLNKGASASVDVSELEAGIYFVKVKGENAERILKLVKCK